MTKNIASILQSGICVSKAFPRPTPSLFYFPGLSSLPVYPASNFPVIADVLTKNADEILKEYLNLREIGMNSDYSLISDEHTLHKGTWTWNSYILKGKVQKLFVDNCPRTVSVLESLPGIMKFTPFSYAFFSTLSPNAVISAHSGPCNLRLRCHFPIIVPKSGDFGMNIGGLTLKWNDREPIFFDDCYEHSVWNKSQEDRVVLLFDIWYLPAAFSASTTCISCL